mgnify:CR=1 FL=1
MNNRINKIIISIMKLGVIKGMKSNMKNRFLLIIVLFFVLGSAIVSSIDSLSHTLKSFFYTIAMAVLIIIGLVYILKYFKRDKG